MSKLCKKCNKLKELIDMCKNKNVCKICKNRYNKEYKLNNKSKIQTYNEIYYHNLHL